MRRFVDEFLDVLESNFSHLIKCTIKESKMVKNISAAKLDLITCYSFHTPAS